MEIDTFEHLNDYDILTFRHLETSYTTNKRLVENSEEYKMFLEYFKEDPFSPEAAILASYINQKFPRFEEDLDVELADGELERGKLIGTRLREMYATGRLTLPEFIVISPAKRARKTFRSIVSGFPELEEKIRNGEIRLESDRRVIEKQVGNLNSYAHNKVYQSLNPHEIVKKMKLGKLSKYMLRYEGSENIPDVMRRAIDWESHIEGNNERTWVFTHSLWMLSYRLFVEGFDGEEDDEKAALRFDEIDTNEMPPTGSITAYKRNGTEERRNFRLLVANLELVRPKHMKTKVK